MKIYTYPEREKWDELLKRPLLNSAEIDSAVLPIIEEVRKNGDKAVREFTRKFDKVNLLSFEVEESEFTEAEKNIDDELKSAIKIAGDNIETFHRMQESANKRVITSHGVDCWQKAVAIEKVGFYIPGGTAPLFSTVLMLAIPARIAGCTETILCTPPSANGSIHPAVLYAARYTGIKKVFKVGGAQAIAAMAFGTPTIPKVYKIFGPGNQYVTAAKQILSRSMVAIDMPAGPSELAVIADESSNASFVAADLLSQAEHGTDSQVLLFCYTEMKANEVLAEINRQVEDLPRKDIAKAALLHSRCFILRSYDEIMGMVNEYAPEHLIISTDNAAELSGMVINAGSVFIGHYSTESAGDYASGTNHTLPTNGYAKSYNGVNLDSFVKKITFQQISREGLLNIGGTIMKMAETEALTAHKNAVAIRIK
ncbi:MAG TPA: histidinol dehydrogenase [Bacteroidales bacterium]|jgi:histidinol dehydrogenase|nr:histidinol dehydrogenase [Bacteroidales bacterium]